MLREFGHNVLAKRKSYDHVVSMFSLLRTVIKTPFLFSLVHGPFVMLTRLSVVDERSRSRSVSVFQGYNHETVTRELQLK